MLEADALRNLQIASDKVESGLHQRGRLQCAVSQEADKNTALYEQRDASEPTLPVIVTGS